MGHQVRGGAAIRGPTSDIQIEDIGQQVRWGLAPILAQEGPPLAHFKEVPMEVEEEGARPAQEDGAIVG